mmetsp:Transcript_18715/g.43447  ORF Transcript_18715/g.43447 Transcript_18715/m.43447 type:complete len:116 (-) Transcript_18715:359-706(-)
MGALFLAEMIGCGLMKSFELMKGRQWSDPDIVEDLDILASLLHQNFETLSSWDVYKVEVETGQLEWGVVHSESFFRENCRKLEGPEGDFELLKVSHEGFLASCLALNRNSCSGTD